MARVRSSPVWGRRPRAEAPPAALPPGRWSRVGEVRSELCRPCTRQKPGAQRGALREEEEDHRQEMNCPTGGTARTSPIISPCKMRT